MKFIAKPRRFIIGLGLLLVACSVYAWWLLNREVSVIEEPLSSSPQTPMLASATKPTTTESTKPTPVKSASATVKPFIDPLGEPIVMEIISGKTRITMRFGPVKESAKPDFESRCGKVALWNEPGWPKPGVLSENMSLITGHMHCGSGPFVETYSIDKLKLVKKGATLRVVFSSGDVTEFRARSDAQSFRKNLLNKSVDRLVNDSKARVVRVTTCDSDGPLRSDGHADWSDVVWFDRIA